MQEHISIVFLFFVRLRVSPFSRPLSSTDGLQLKFLSFDELHMRMTNLDSEMEREIFELRRRYQAKRQPILDAMEQKRKRQQNF